MITSKTHLFYKLNYTMHLVLSFHITKEEDFQAQECSFETNSLDKY